MLPMESIRRSALAWSVAGCSLIGLLLLGYGALLIPTASRLSLGAAAAVLLAYVAAGLFLIPRAQGIEGVVAWAGAAAALVFAAEISLEYVFLPKDNSSYGLIEFGLVFLIYIGAGARLTLANLRLRDAAMGAALSAVVSSVVWCIFVLGEFYLFFGTSRQEQILRAEGDFEDFSRSGMHDFPAFIMEDFCGAAFFHLLLGPALAGLLGTLGGLIGIGLTKINRRRIY